VLSAVSASKAGREKLFGHVLSPLAEATRHAERGLRGHHHHHHRHLSERDEEEEEEEEKEVERSNDGGGGSSGGGSNSGAGGSGSGGIKRGTRGESSSSSHAVAASMKGVESDNPGGVVLAELVATKVAVVHATLEQLCRDMNAARPADVDDEDDDAATAAMSTDVATTTAAAAAAVSASTEISSSAAAAAAAASDSSASYSAVIAATAPHNKPTPVQRTRGLGFLDLNHRGRLARSPVGPASISSALGETVPLPEPVGAAMVPAAQVPLTTNTTQDDEDEDGSMAI
jgi:hypothetical protein